VLKDTGKVAVLFNELEGCFRTNTLDRLKIVTAE
jgi:hypothetical protein